MFLGKVIRHNNLWCRVEVIADLKFINSIFVEKPETKLNKIFGDDLTMHVPDNDIKKLNFNEYFFFTIKHIKNNNSTISIDKIFREFKAFQIIDNRNIDNIEIHDYTPFCVSVTEKLIIGPIIQDINSKESKLIAVEGKKLQIWNREYIDTFIKNKHTLVMLHNTSPTIENDIGSLINAFNNVNKQYNENKKRSLTAKNINNISYYNNTLTEISLDVYKGLFVPNIEWGRVYCQQNENYYHLTVTIDPSIRNISDLWNNYLKAIHNEAKESPENKYVVHFTGINFSFPEVWIPAVKSLVDADNIRVPVDGLPYWVPNIYFFFTPVFNPDAFPITEELFSLFPAIDNEIPKNSFITEIEENIQHEILLEMIKDKMVVNNDNAKIMLNRLIKGYSDLYMKKWIETVRT